MAELFPPGSGIVYRSDGRRLRRRGRPHRDDPRVAHFDPDGGLRDFRPDRHPLPLGADRSDHDSSQRDPAGRDVWLHGAAGFRSECGQRDRVHDQPGDRRRQYHPLHPAAFGRSLARIPTWTRATWKTMLGKGQPMCLSTFLTVIGLAVLLLSDFVPTRRFAELTIVTLTGALIGALFLLPRLRSPPVEAAAAAAATGPRTGTAGLGTPAKLTAPTSWRSPTSSTQISSANDLCHLMHLRHSDCISGLPEILSTNLAAAKSHV